MPKTNYWFKAKTYGYGWYPATWQGGLVILVYLVILGGLVYIFESNVDKYLVFYLVSVFASSGLLVYISYKKGEPAKWRWGRNNKWKNIEEIKLKLSTDLKEAMKEKNILAVETIRSLMSAIDNAGAVIVAEPEKMPMSGGIAGATSGLGSTEVSRKELSVEDIKKIIQKEIDELAEAVESIKDYSRPEAKQFVEKMNVLKKYLD